MTNEDNELEKTELKIQGLIKNIANTPTTANLQTLANILTIQCELLLTTSRRYKLRADEIIKLTEELIKLSKAAEYQTEKLINLTKILKRYTVGLFILTIALVLFGVASVYTMLNQKPNVITNNYTTNSYINNTDTAHTTQNKTPPQRMKVYTQNKANDKK